MYTGRVRSFSETHSSVYEKHLVDEIKSEIESKGKEYILGVDEEEYQQYLIGKYTLEPLSIDYSSESIGEPTINKEWLEDRHYREKYQAEVYKFTVRYLFSGSVDLFKIQPNTWSMRSAEIYVNEDSNTVSFSFKLYNKDPEEFQRKKSDYQEQAFANMNNANVWATKWTNSLPSLISSLFQQQKTKYQQENDFFTAINIKVNNDTKSVFTTPTIKKKIIPQPAVSKNKEFAIEPKIAIDMYDDILKVIYDFGKSVSRQQKVHRENRKIV